MGQAQEDGLIDKFWSKLSSDVIAQTVLNAHEKLTKLIPDEPAFWYANNLSIMNYPTDIDQIIKDGRSKCSERTSSALTGTQV